ncbi:glycoside hydrolase family 36 protein [uncultured Treponema sp.]|uniref:glycoside hydrolase family 36 protein n=1 Tax=uncultured Treponema sp. TaxID=162155 RepID=UPI0025E4B065|nr:glycoside hydrolase family 36 protein [uncultured Treponema sp.]
MKELDRNEYFYHGADCTDSENRIFATLSVDSLLEKQLGGEAAEFCKKNDFAFYGSGWQGWGFGGEINPGEYQKKYFPVVPQWKNYFTVPGRLPKSLKSKKLLVGSFFIYLRWNMNGKNLYLAVASTGNVKGLVPPVSFYVDRKKREITCTVYADGKTWHEGDKIAELAVFVAGDFFELRETTQKLFAEDKEARFGTLNFLNSTPQKGKISVGGWESWYNHYADINNELIQGDLEGLGKTENLIKTHFLDSKKPCVFQVDDGWEISLGDWDARTDRFPQGMNSLASSIAEKGYVPGLWIAPFIVDLRSELVKNHTDWLLRDKKGKPVTAGFNPLWGANFGKDQPSFPGSYFCLDLSRDDVLEHLDALIEKAVNEWGFRYLKLDFLFAGLIRGEFKNGGAAYEWYDRAVKVLTKRTMNKNGERVAYLGCGMPFESSFKAFPLSRIGTDTKEDWDISWMKKSNYPSRPSAFVNMQDTLGHAFWDNGVYINDPDVVFLRYENISLTDKEKILIALVNYLFASQTMHSDDPVHFDSEKEGAFTKKIEQLYELFEDEDFGVENRNATSYFIFSKNEKYTGFINLGDEPVYIERTELVSRFSGKTENLESVVDYGTRMTDGFHFEPHSISIYERK